MVKTNAERQREWRQKQLSDPDMHAQYKRRERARNAARRVDMVVNQTLAQHQKKVKQATREWRKRVKAQKEAEAPAAVNEEQASGLEPEPLTPPAQPYKSAASLGRATRRVENNLPNSPRKREEVVKKLATKVLGPTFRLLGNQELQQRHEKEVDRLVKEFYQNDSISRVMPGKADTITTWTNGKKEAHQKRHLTLTVGEAFQLFREEQPEYQIGKSKFAALRPAWVLLSSQMPHNSCGCKYHANIIEMLEALHRKLPTIFPMYSPEFLQKCVCDLNNEACMSDGCDVCSGSILFDRNFKQEVPDDTANDDHLRWFQWQPAESGFVEKVAFRGTVQRAVERLRDLLPQFLWHVFLKHMQSTAYAKQKEEAQEASSTTATVQMDFSENYTAVYQDAIQSAYYGQRQITVYTVTVWTRGTTTSQVILSDVREHDKSSVTAYTMTVLEGIKQNHPDVTTIKIWTDGPSSQYKNKYIFALCKLLSVRYNLQIYWNYFATSHGKGPCDALGGTAKRVVNRRVLADKNMVVNDAGTFCRTLLDTGTSIHCKVLNAEEAEAKVSSIGAQKVWDSIKSANVPGTMNVHWVHPSEASDDVVTLKFYSEAQDTREFVVPALPQVITQMATLWLEAPMPNEDEASDDPLPLQVDQAPDVADFPAQEAAQPTHDVTDEPDSQDQADDDPPPRDQAVPPHLDELLQPLTIDEFVAVVYDDKEWYVGKVVELDEGRVRITFMEEEEKESDSDNVSDSPVRYLWPRLVDRAWVTIQAVLCRVVPLPVGKGRRPKFFTLSEPDSLKIQQLYGQHQR